MFWIPAGDRIFPEKTIGVSKNGFHDKHVFFQSIRGPAIDWNAITAPMAQLTPDCLDRLMIDVPEAWKTHEKKIRDHIEFVRSSLDRFAIGLSESVRTR